MTIHVPSALVTRGVKTVVFAKSDTDGLPRDRQRFTLVEPSGSVRFLQAFTYRAFSAPSAGSQTQNPISDLGIAVRFRPSSIGQHRILEEIAKPDWQVFQVKVVDVTDAHDSEFSVPRFRMGINMAWHSTDGPVDSLLNYDRWLSQFAANGGGLIRLIMTRWGLSFSPPSFQLDILSSVPQDRCSQIDWVLDRCAAHDIAVVFCGFTFSDFKAGPGFDWIYNPLNVRNGGPCEKPSQVFTSAEATEWIGELLRYMVARWGSYGCVVAWELFNEVDQVDGYIARDCESWFKSLSELLHHCDEQQRSIWISHAFPTGVKSQRQVQAPVYQIHNYGWPSRIPAVNCLYWAQHLRIKSGNSWLLSEISIRSDRAPIREDSTGELTRSALWASLFSGWLAPAWPWFWDTHIAVMDLWHVWRGISKFCEAVKWIEKPWAATAVDIAYPKVKREDLRFPVARSPVGTQSPRALRLMRAGALGRMVQGIVHECRYYIWSFKKRSPTVLGLYRIEGKIVRVLAWVSHIYKGQDHFEAGWITLYLRIVFSEAPRVILFDTHTGEAVAARVLSSRPGSYQVELPRSYKDLAIEFSGASSGAVC